MKRGHLRRAVAIGLATTLLALALTPVPWWLAWNDDGHLAWVQFFGSPPRGLPFAIIASDADGVFHAIDYHALPRSSGTAVLPVGWAHPVGEEIPARSLGFTQPYQDRDTSFEVVQVVASPSEVTATVVATKPGDSFTSRYRISPSGIEPVSLRRSYDNPVGLLVGLLFWVPVCLSAGVIMGVVTALLSMRLSSTQRQKDGKLVANRP